MVLKAAVISIPVMNIGTSDVTAFAVSQRYVLRTSVVFLFDRYELCDCDRYLVVLIFILFNVMSDSILRIMMSSVMGLRFFNGPSDFFGFSKAITTPLPISTSVLCFSKMLLSI